MEVSWNKISTLLPQLSDRQLFLLIYETCANLTFRYENELFESLIVSRWRSHSTLKPTPKARHKLEIKTGSCKQTLTYLWHLRASIAGTSLIQSEQVIYTSPRVDI